MIDRVGIFNWFCPVGASRLIRQLAEVEINDSPTARIRNETAGKGSAFGVSSGRLPV
jgi:hypothetical protein